MASVITCVAFNITARALSGPSREQLAVCINLTPGQAGLVKMSLNTWPWHREQPRRWA